MDATERAKLNELINAHELMIENYEEQKRVLNNIINIRNEQISTLLKVLTHYVPDVGESYRKIIEKGGTV